MAPAVRHWVVSCTTMLAIRTMLLLHAEAFTPLHSTGYCQLFVQSYGYQCTESVVPTDDGYLLAVQRVGAPTTPPIKGPVFLYHGIMEGGEIWVMNSRDQSLAFTLADAGYDVWIGNTRSSNYTFGHATYIRSDKAFWNWNWDDLVAKDLPVMLQFVYAQTNRPINYVGYSQGSMTAFAAFSQGPLVSLVSKAAMLSPVAYVGHITSPFAAAACWLFADQILLLAGVAEFSVSSQAGQKFLDITCTSPQVDCRHDVISLITGPNCCFNQSRLPAYYRYELQSTSMQNLAQMAQLVRSGSFGMYDYGFWGNLRRYSSLFPPEYDLTAIPQELPVFLAHGGNDALSDPQDVSILISSLQGTPQVLYMPNYAHGDFVMGDTVKADVYSHIVTFFDT